MWVTYIIIARYPKNTVEYRLPLLLRTPSMSMTGALPVYKVQDENVV